MKSLQYAWFSLLLLLINITTLFSQDPALSIQHDVLQEDTEFNIHFLASDEFLGRRTGTQELDIAAKYIATWFQIHGVAIVPGHNSWFQDVPLRLITPPGEATIAMNDSLFTLGVDFLSLNTFRGEIETQLQPLEYATAEEISNHELNGKIVITRTGFPDSRSPQQMFFASSQKKDMLKKAGAVGLIELFSSRQMPWPFLMNFLGEERFDLDENPGEDETFAHTWVNSTRFNPDLFLEQVKQSSASIHVKGKHPEFVVSRNVLGFIEGTDPDLKDEVLLLSAHYDHIGVVNGQDDGNNIYNGARDNAIGISSILQAAKYFASNPPKRSILVAAWTAEEEGLLGSRYYSENPLFPLKKIVYNINSDGGGYNDTTKVTVIGLGRTEADEELKAAATAFELEAIADPVPEQNLFDRSDNVNFASRGIPSPTYTTGLTAFDQEILKYYHQVLDEPDTINYFYVTNYIRSFVLAAHKIANRDTAPFWLPGDVYETAGNELYNRP